jgi:hypothetical protein
MLNMGDRDGVSGLADWGPAASKKKGKITSGGSGFRRDISWCLRRKERHGLGDDVTK